MLGARACDFHMTQFKFRGKAEISFGGGLHIGFPGDGNAGRRGVDLFRLLNEIQRFQDLDVGGIARLYLVKIERKIQWAGHRIADTFVGGVCDSEVVDAAGSATVVELPFAKAQIGIGAQSIINLYQHAFPCLAVHRGRRQHRGCGQSISRRQDFDGRHVFQFSQRVVFVHFGGKLHHVAALHVITRIHVNAVPFALAVLNEVPHTEHGGHDSAGGHNLTVVRRNRRLALDFIDRLRLHRQRGKRQNYGRK